MAAARRRPHRRRSGLVKVAAATSADGQEDQGRQEAEAEEEDKDLSASECGAPKPSASELELHLERRRLLDESQKTADDLLRLQADLQNYRRDHNKAMALAQDLGKSDVLRRLAPVVAEVETRLQAAPAGLSENAAKAFESYSLLFKKVGQVWNQLGVTSLDVTEDEAVDERRHCVVEERNDSGKTPGTILEVLTRGWLHEGKVLVRAEVAVAGADEGQ